MRLSLAVLALLYGTLSRISTYGMLKNYANLDMLACLFVVNPKAEFNAHIDAPVETQNELARVGIVEKLHHQRHHQGNLA